MLYFVKDWTDCEVYEMKLSEMIEQYKGEQDDCGLGEMRTEQRTNPGQGRARSQWKEGHAWWHYTRHKEEGDEGAGSSWKMKHTAAERVGN